MNRMPPHIRNNPPPQCQPIDPLRRRPVHEKRPTDHLVTGHGAELIRLVTQGKLRANLIPRAANPYWRPCCLQA